jgi:hypothetical protein
MKLGNFISNETEHSRNASKLGKLFVMNLWRPIPYDAPLNGETAEKYKLIR